LLQNRVAALFKFIHARKRFQGNLLIDDTDVVGRFGFVQQRYDFFAGKSHSNPDTRQRPCFAECLHHNKVGVFVYFAFQAVFGAKIHVSFVCHHDSVKVFKQLLQVVQPVPGGVIR
jgi:hypothetical protein